MWDVLLEVGVGLDNGRIYKYVSGMKVGGLIFDEVGKCYIVVDLF